MSNDLRCRGFRLYKMDSKFRITIPPSWRLESGDTLFLQLSMGHGMPVLKVFGQDVYQEQVERIRESYMTPQEKHTMLGHLAMCCREAFLDQRGRILIPNDMRSRLDIAPEAGVILVGRGTHFEIWNKENFDAMQRIESTLLEDQDLGIF